MTEEPMTDTDDASTGSPLDPERLHGAPQDSLGVDAAELKDMVLVRYMKTVSRKGSRLSRFIGVEGRPRDFA
jgi:hypothetical protein